MLIGLGEPFMDPQIFERIEFCHRHSISTLLSTNGTFLDERYAGSVLDSPLEQITLSFDGAKKETFEFYRKGAKFEKVRDNFVRFAAHEARAAVRAAGGGADGADGGQRRRRWTTSSRFWSAVPGVDQVRIKADETNLMRPDAGHTADEWKHPCHYLWRGPMYVKQNGDVYPCCQSYMLDGEPRGQHRRAAAGRDLEFGARCRRCARCTRPGAAAKSTSARAAAPPFRIRRW